MSGMRQLIDQANQSGCIPTVVSSRAGKKNRSATGRRLRQRVTELEDMRRVIADCQTSLLDYNPTLGLMAESLHKAIELEIAARSCSVSLLDTDAA